MIRAAPSISWTPGAGEITLFDSRDGSYHALNPSAAEIWTGVAGGESQDVVARAIAARHGVEPEIVAAHVEEFVDAALAKGLLYSD